MHGLPLFLKLEGTSVLVVGGGRVAARRVRSLSGAGAAIRLVAPSLGERLAGHLDNETSIDWHRRTYRAADLSGCRLAFAATNDPVVNACVVADARARGIWAQRADDAAAGDFYVPAVVDRSPLVIALSTGAAAPVLARALRTRLETMVPAGFGEVARFAGRWRREVTKRLPAERRRRFWERVIGGPIAEQVMVGRTEEADRAMAAALVEGDAPEQGEVYLVGAGPGDPDLLTFRALRLMQQADTVLYDSLVAESVLGMVRADAERIHVGKRASRHTLPQSELNELMVRLSREGKRVLRLKGGDPFVFGRGGEEIEDLADAGIPFQVVPGVTAANGCAAYAGIPLTHRDYAQSVQFVTGHLKAGELDLDWPRLAAASQTLVFFMGRQTLPRICERLMAHGLPATHPAALIEAGTTPRQRVVVGDLQRLPDKVAKVGVRGPSLVIVGDVVRLNDKLGWFRPDKDS